MLAKKGVSPKMAKMSYDGLEDATLGLYAGDKSGNCTVNMFVSTSNKRFMG